MSDKDLLIQNIEKIHTTELGVTRIKRNLTLPDCDAVEYCKDRITDKKAIIYKEGKNFYCEINGERITVNSYSFTIITAHKIK
ncbi:MAG: DUF3781 domain-containing protein [Ruminiclostridium sp.]|nr:DUF3781 domain-containing protein [Ruminiclostridium sp.]